MARATLALTKSGTGTWVLSGDQHLHRRHHGHRGHPRAGRRQPGLADHGEQRGHARLHPRLADHLDGRAHAGQRHDRDHRHGGQYLGLPADDGLRRITGTPTLDSAITDYELELRNSDTELWLVYTGAAPATPSTPGQAELERLA